MPTVAVIGGGAAGFFGAITCAGRNPALHVVLLEGNAQVLGKVRISGGGRCNLTHACFDPHELIKFYPRGSRELHGPFTKFHCGHTVQWFESRGVRVKQEADGRMFPVTDRSQTVMDCLLSAAQQARVEVRTRARVSQLEPSAGRWNIMLAGGENILADAVLFTPGSGNETWNMLRKLGHTIVEPVPSLFTFNISDPRLAGMSGVSVPHAIANVKGTKWNMTGPLLITHWGMSGPAILKLSAFAARELAEKGYHFTLVVNWTGKQSASELLNQIHTQRSQHGKRKVPASPLFEIPGRLWEKLCTASRIDAEHKWADLTAEMMEALAGEIAAGEFVVNGKSTFKEEFVTAGGVSLREVDFRSFRSKLFPSLYFAGEVLDIDAVTGGFNFQAAWTGGWIAGNAIAEAFTGK